MNNRVDIGIQLAKIRSIRGMSTRELAEKCGVHYSNICKIEKGAYNVSIDILYKICTALEADIKIIEKEKIKATE